MATRLPHEHVAFRELSLKVYIVRRSPTFTFGWRWQWWLLQIWLVGRQMQNLAGEKPSAKNTRRRASLDSSLLQFFREVQALEMN
jgi:hypothetical protein